MDKQHTFIGSCPAHWEVVKFSTVAELKHGYQFRTSDFVEDGIKIFKITQIKGDGSIDLSSCSFIDSSRLESFDKNIINKSDILMALSGATIGKIGRFKSKEVVLQNYRVGNFIPLNEETLNKDFFYYFLTTENTYYQILANQNQSAQENVGKEDIHNMLVFLPPLSEQKAIAEVLSSLDDKIDLLHRQNKTLEQMAETLFRQWFVEEAMEDWEEGTLADIMEFNPIYRISKGASATYLEMKNVSTSTFNPNDWYKRDYTSGMKFQNGDAIIARITPCIENGKTAFITFLKEGQIGWGSTEYIVMRMKEPYHKFISYLIAKDNDFRDFAISSMSGSSGRQRAQAIILKTFEIKIPSSDFVEKINEQLEPMVQKLKYNAIQIKTLEKLRDTFLPKLMSGEVKVSIDE